MDYSGHKNHAINKVPAGVERGGKGYSAMFNGNNYLEIPHSDDFNSKVFSVTFWLYIIQGHGNAADDQLHKRVKWCPIFQKGKDDELEKVFLRAPGLFISGEDGSLKVVVSSTETGKFPEGEKTISNARIP